MANVTFPVANGTWEETLYASNGSVWGYFEHYAWVLRLGQNDSGSSETCTSRVFTELVDDWTSTTFPLYNNTWNFSSDAQEPDSVNTSWTAATTYFDNGFTNATGLLSTCGTAAAVRHVASTHIEVGLLVKVLGQWQLIYDELNVTSSFTYSFPADTGTWQIDNLSAPGGPGGGWAFSYAPCP